MYFYTVYNSWNHVKFLLRIISTKSYGHSAGYCYLDLASSRNENNTVKLIKDDVKSKVIVISGVIQVLTLIVCITNLVFFFLLSRQTRKEGKLASQYCSRLKWYPIIQTISSSPQFIYCSYFIFSSTRKQPFILFATYQIFISLRPLFFSIAFCISSNIRESLLDKLRGIFKRNEDREISEEVKIQLSRLDTLSEAPEEKGNKKKDIISEKNLRESVNNEENENEQELNNNKNDVRDSVISFN